ncbi:hypothetical protein PPERSA_06589 [Pseudocohnilembus persalinus]|uniref:Uncharacterized protein n=1 Tax=Pseudocohnilembus persalinus TaxID=266149 RepID=A0A0V0QRQ5_PSEPJ|nr:hypothetical protein PPERSA_06589 [Pseudocohnilembus persalinus]|eukprot:KRX04955.1 hypothetical protein PPERSA_06589 [Pseudocohnilembus persalinus]
MYDIFFYFCEFLFHNLLDDSVFVETYYNNSDFKDVLSRYGEQLFGQLQNDNLNFAQDQVIQEKRNIYLSLYEELKLGEENRKQVEDYQNQQFYNSIKIGNQNYPPYNANNNSYNTNINWQV